MYLQHVMPSPQQYNMLARAAGVPEKVEEELQVALNRSLFGVALLGTDGEPIGMGRMIGDGRYTFLITDLILRPEYASEDNIRTILHALTDFIEENASAGAEIILMADVPSIAIYQKHGFSFTYPNKISLSRSI
ncbi:GNAT family N-acetyltransferase [Paenibacillus sp. NPDC057967]|uniref:GNAT family N-acetyltransferase n=1 Tax=Paenibacillus sp. NPDC057967 TaxID=3346293 RepID=UPI0036D994A0